MKYKIIDKKYRFISAFDTDNGAYVRTAIIDDDMGARFNQCFLKATPRDNGRDSDE